VKLTMKNTKDTKKFAAAKIRRRCAIFPGDATFFTMAACRHAGSNGLWAKTDPGVRFRGRAAANGPAATDGAWYQRRARAGRDGESTPGKIRSPGIARCQL